MKGPKHKPDPPVDPTSWTASLSMARWKPLAAKIFKRQKESPKIASLPYEILLVIFESLDERSVACMLRTCRFFRNVVEPILYRHIRVYHGPEYEALRPNPIKPHLLHRTLVGRLDLLPVILSYHGPLVPNHRVSFDAYAPKRKKELWRKIKTTTRQQVMNNLVFDEYLEKARTIFSRTINIQELHFTGEIAPYIAQVLSVLDAPKSKKMNIKKLVLNVEWCSPALVPILRTLPGLKHLELPRLRGGEIQLDETDLPQLESLKAELQHAAQIVPGRPIKKLELVYDWRPDQDQLWQRLTLSTCAITEFTVPPTFSWHDAFDRERLQCLARYLPGIQRLCFQLPREVPDWISTIYTPRTVLDSILLETLPDFPSLSHLKLIGCLCSTLPKENSRRIMYTEANFGHFVQRLKTNSMSLVEVEWGPAPAWHSCCCREDENPLRYCTTQ